MRRTTLLLALPCSLALTLGGCDIGGPGGKPDPPAAEILDLTVEPNPVAVGDTATFTCIVEDSTATRLEFWWDVSTPGNFATTDTNQYRWPVTVSPGDYRLTVQVDRTGGAFDEVQAVVDFTVIASE